MTRAPTALLCLLCAAGATGCADGTYALDAGVDASHAPSDVGTLDGSQPSADADVGDAGRDEGAAHGPEQGTDGGPNDLDVADGGLDVGASAPDLGPEPTLPEGTVTPLPPALRTEVGMILPAAHAFLLSQGDVDPIAHFAGDLLARRFAVAGFEQALARFDQATTTAPGPIASIMRLLRRVFDFDSPLVPGDLESLDALTDRVTMPALQCDRAEWPADYDARLQAAEAQGDYGTTHVLPRTPSDGPQVAELDGHRVMRAAGHGGDAHRLSARGRATRDGHHPSDALCASG